MMVKPSDLLRYVLLIVLAASHVSSCYAHDWPFRVGASERFHTQVRFEPDAILASYSETGESTEWLSLFANQVGDYVSQRSMAADLGLGKYIVVPELFLSPKADKCDERLLVAKPVPGIAPQPTGEVQDFIVYSEHCFSDSYLPFDNAIAPENSSQPTVVSNQQVDWVSSWIENKLGRLSAWHCELIEQCHSGQFAIDTGVALGNLRVGNLGSNDADGIKLPELNSETLPKFVYLHTRGGIVLAPAGLAEAWSTPELASVGSPPELLFDAANDLRAMVSGQLQNIAGSLISVARVVEPSSEFSRVANRRAVSKQ